MKAEEKTKGGIANLKPCKPGETRNPRGRPKGQRNYITIYREALRKIGETKGMTPDEVEDQMEMSGLGKAIKGDFNFQKDVKDRIHGRPVQKEQHSGDILITIKRL